MQKKSNLLACGVDEDQLQVTDLAEWYPFLPYESDTTSLRGAKLRWNVFWTDDVWRPAFVP